MSEQRNKIVLITGASSGIGKATAYLFAANSYDLIITGRRVTRLAEIKSELEQAHNIRVKCLAFDIRDKNEVARHIDSLGAEWNPIDTLINNAGLAKGFDPIHEGSLDHWETMIDTNIKGLLYMTRKVAPMMVEAKHGHIINVASTAGHEVYPKGNVYCATKFAVDALTKGMRLDLHAYNIRISQVSPGHVEETYNDFNPLTSSDVAEIIHFIATRKKHINIQDVLVMGTQQASSYQIDRSGRN